MPRVVIGVDIGGTKVAAYIDDGTPTGQAYQTRPTPSASQPQMLQGVARTSAEYPQILQNGRAALLQVVVNLCRELITIAQEKRLDVAAIGIGTAGQVDSATGTVVDANENLVGWKDTPLAAYLEKALNLPVFVDNDVRVMALAEYAHHQADYHHALCMTVGTGIGGALIIQGKLWDGGHQRAGEIGYFYAAPGETIEDRYSGPGLVRRFLETYPAEPADLTLRDIAQRAINGDTACIETIQQGAVDLAQVLAPVIAFIDPDAVIVGGGVVEIGALWWQPFVETLQDFRLKHISQIAIVQAQLGNRAGMIGAALLAKQKVGLL